MAKLTKEEKQLLIFNRLAEELIKGLQTKIPKSSAFPPFGFGFDIIDSSNHGLMRIEYYREDQRMLRLGVYRKGTDRLYSNYLKTGTNEALITYLQDSCRIPEWLEAMNHLSAKVDDYF